MNLPELARELADSANFATVSTVQPDGSPYLYAEIRVRPDHVAGHTD
jgi:hypothetical protein